MAGSPYQSFRHECTIPNGNSFLLDLDNDWIASKEYIQDEAHEHVKIKRSDVLVELSENLTFKLPFRFNELAKRIVAAKYILELEDNWDDEGSKSYSERTLKQAIDFIIEYTHWVWDTLNIVITPPKILHGPDQSIDLLWERPSYELLINIPPHPKKIVRFYGDNRKDARIEGQFNINEYGQGVFLCLLANERQIP